MEFLTIQCASELNEKKNNQYRGRVNLSHDENQTISNQKDKSPSISFK